MVMGMTNTRIIMDGTVTIMEIINLGILVSQEWEVQHPEILMEAKVEILGAVHMEKTQSRNLLEKNVFHLR